MYVDELMTCPVVCCSGDDTLEQAAELMWRHDCGALPVTGEHGQLHGMVTDRDLCMATWTTGLRLADLLVREAMAIDVVAARPTQTLREAERAMRDHRVRRLPVLDAEDRVIGMLTCNDLIRRATDRATERITEQVTDRATPRPEGHAPLHLLQTLAVVGRARTTKAPVPLPQWPPRPRPAPRTGDDLLAAIAAAVSAHME